MIRVEGVTHAEDIVYYVSRDTVALIRLIFTILKFLSAARCQFFFSIHLMMLIQRSKTCVMSFVYFVPALGFSASNGTNAAINIVPTPRYTFRKA